MLLKLAMLINTPIYVYYPTNFITKLLPEHLLPYPYCFLYFKGKSQNICIQISKLNYLKTTKEKS